MDVVCRYAYVTPTSTKNQTTQLIEQFLNNFQIKWRQSPKWFISDNAGEYISKVVTDPLGDMHLPIVEYNPEENCLSERLNLTLMNAVRASLKTTKLG